MSDSPQAPEEIKAALPYRIWAAHCPFRKNGTPVLGTMGSGIRTVIVIEADTWKRLCADVPQLQTTQFEVGTFE